MHDLVPAIAIISLCLIGCTEPECLEGERKIGNECISTKSRDASASPIDVADARVGDASATSGEMSVPDFRDGQADAAVDSNAGPVSEPTSASDAGLPDSAAAPQTNECQQVSICPDAYPCVDTEDGYTCLGQFADWRVPGLILYPKIGVPTRYLQTGSTITDSVTMLEWQSVLPGTYEGCTFSTPAGAACTWKEAKTYCNDLVYSGRDDWRLPSAVELISVTRYYSPIFDYPSFPYRRYFVDPKYPTPGPDNWQYGAWWTASVLNENGTSSPIQLYRKDLSRVVTARPAGDGGQVICVRGTNNVAGTPTQRITVQGAVATDAATGLTWQLDVGTFSSLATARAGCVDGFRLPTYRELFTLLDFSRTTYPYVRSEISRYGLGCRWFDNGSDDGPVARGMNMNEHGAEVEVPFDTAACTFWCVK